MSREYRRISHTYMERVTDEEILMDAGHVHLRANERRHFHEELWVNGDWTSGHSKAMQLITGRSANDPERHQPLGGK